MPATRGGSVVTEQAPKSPGLEAVAARMGQRKLPGESRGRRAFPSSPATGRGPLQVPDDPPDVPVPEATETTKRPTSVKETDRASRVIHLDDLPGKPRQVNYRLRGDLEDLLGEIADDAGVECGLSVSKRELLEGLVVAGLQGLTLDGVVDVITDYRRTIARARQDHQR